MAESELTKQATEIDLAGADISQRYADVYEDRIPGPVQAVRWTGSAYIFECTNEVVLDVQWTTPAIVRLCYSPDGFFYPEQSYAINPNFKPDKVAVTLEEDDHFYHLKSELLQVTIRKSDLQVAISDLTGQVFCAQQEGYRARRTILRGWCRFSMELNKQANDVFFGLGDKTGNANLANRKFENWCTDAFAFGNETDPLYRSIPFYYSLQEGRAYGIFLDNSFRSHFDFGHSDPQTTKLIADGGQMNFYYIHGPSLIEVARGYAALTGFLSLPPHWALGYHQCRWSYFPENRVLEVAETFRKLQIPCDAIYLDIDYMDGYRCFTWNAERFPNPTKLIAELKSRGFHVVSMIDPGIKEDPNYPIYQEGIKMDHFIKTADGDTAKGPVWPGFCAFPDFSSPRTRSWWGTLYRNLYEENGISGFWNDMNEPAVFHIQHKTLADDVRHQGEGFPCSHRQAHNTYGLLMTRASVEGLAQIKPGKRPFLLTRATYSGGQRYACVWTGDNCSTWEHLQIANVQCQRLSVSGFSFCGSDIGGFTGNCEGELLVRWLQLAVFHPLMRTHNSGQHALGDALVEEEAELSNPRLHQTDQEPWSFGDPWTNLARKAIELRYSLFPELYTAMWRASMDGTPVIRHPSFMDQADQRLWEQDRDFLFGQHLFVSPVIHATIIRQAVYLPKGQWYYFWTGQLMSAEIAVPVKPDEIPFFVKAGGVLPVYPVRQNTEHKEIEELTLYVYYKNGKELSQLYEDEGEGYEYARGNYCLRVFEVEGDASSCTLRQRQSGTFTPTYQKVIIYLVGFPHFLKSCSVDSIEAKTREVRLYDHTLYRLDQSPDFSSIVWHA